MLCGPSGPAGKVWRTPISLHYLYPTITGQAGIGRHLDDADLPGASLVTLANEKENPDRLILSDYHAIGSDSAGYMIADAKYKYHEYVDYPPALFALAIDSGAAVTSADQPEYHAVSGR